MDTCLEGLHQDLLRCACRALAEGQIIAHPTETVFGFAVDPFNPEAVTRLLRLKGRASERGLILLIPDRSWLERLILPPPPLASCLMERFWPGPLTLLLPARPDLPPTVTGGSGFVALRHSSSPLVADLLAIWQRPLVSTSANRSGQPTACSAAIVRQQWGEVVPVILAGQSAAGARPSTLVRVEGTRFAVVREGAVAGACLQKAVVECHPPLDP
ncbi:MAG: threonylcarbamoyl-AMP synthase [Magnetococcales bacterium]|nr:threonylcarbamoyl-AMP synthase [Magnetococcales bacterium]